MSLSTIKQYLQQGAFQRALSLSQEQHETLKHESEFWYLQAVAQRYLGLHQEALISLQSLLQLAPHHARAQQEIAHNHRVLKQPKVAVKHYLQAIRLNPSLFASWQHIEALTDDPEQRKTASLNLEYLSKLEKPLLSVTSFIYENKLEKAESLCRNFLLNQPKHVEAMRLLAKIADKHHVLDDAEFLLETCHRLEPDNHWVQFDYIHVLNRRQKFEQAYSKATTLADKLPGDLTTQLTLANQQAAVGEYQIAVESYQKLIVQDSENPLLPLLLGHVYKTLGKQQAAIEMYLKCVELDPLMCDAYWSLANLKTYQFEHSVIAEMMALVDRVELQDEARVQLLFALGKAKEGLKDYKASFQYYQRGNDLKAELTGYDRNVMSNNFVLQQQFFTPENIQRINNFGSQSREPIFILGLPRTGSTLVEQILSSHSQIDGTLELPHILSYVQELNGRKFKDKGARYPSILGSLETKDFEVFAQRYLDETQVYRDGGSYFTDKMPNNFRHIGLIKSIFPNAKIIDTRREVRSCCFAIFKQLFAEGQEFSYRWQDIVSYYKGYVELMDHWHRVYPNQILTLNYEEVVADPEQSIKSLFEYLEIDVEPACFEFHKTVRAVRTASSEQVRQPINTQGRDQWKHYQPYLTELLELLDD